MGVEAAMGEEDAASRRCSTKQTWASRHLALHVFPEGDPLLRGVLVHAAAVQEVHGHIQRVLHIALEAKVLVPDEGQHARPVGVHIRPDVTPPAHIPCTIGLTDMRLTTVKSRSLTLEYDRITNSSRYAAGRLSA